MIAVSIAVCSKGRPEELRALAKSLRKLIDNNQSVLAELVIIEDVSELESNLRPETVKEADQYHVIDVHEAGFGLIRQAAVDAANGAIIIFIDDDCLPCNDSWLPDLLQPFSDQDVVAVGGGIVPQEGNAITKAIALIGLPAGGLPRLIVANEEDQTSDVLSTGNLALRRSAVLDIGGFDTQHRFGGEDQQLVGKLIGKKLFLARALVAHRNRDSFADVWRWFVRRGQGEYKINQLSGMGGFLAMISPVRWSWSWRLLVLGVIGFFLGFSGLGALLLLYYLLLLAKIVMEMRGVPKIQAVAEKKESCFQLPAILIAPVLRIWMDFAREWGRLKECLSNKESR